MNILFYSSWAISPQWGGAERKITSLVSNLSRKWNVNCYSVYERELPDKFERTAFKDSLKFDPQRDNTELLNQFIGNHHIDICLCFENIKFLSLFVVALRKCGDIKIICNHTYSPMSESSFFIKNLQAFSFTQLYKAIKVRYYKCCYEKWLHKCFRNVYQLSDHIVVMSPRHRKDFMKCGNIHDEHKFTIIHNMLSYNKFFDINLYAQKKKEVLIVSRFSEIEKRILLSLRIWEYIEKKTHLSDWHLTIVGHGDSEQDYKDFVRQHQLQRVSFEGKQEPQSYYERASIFMSTSITESWGNTLTEAQQFACVPLAFNSLIALPMIITDGVNGYAIPAKNIRCYTQRLIQLMTDDKLRKELAGNAVESSHRFEQEKIAEEWYNLLTYNMK